MRTKTLPALLLLAVLVGACGGGTQSSGDGTRAGDGDSGLTGREFVSERVEEGGVERPLVPSTQIRLDFREGQVGASAGCNLFTGRYEVDGDRLVVDDLGGTEMGCDEPRHAQDQWLVALLESGPSFELDGDRLVLTSGDTVVSFLDREVADPDRPLVGPTWVLDTLIKGEVASNVPVDVRASLSFADDGRVAIETGCNSGSGRYVLDGDSLSITSIETTLVACKDERGAVEKHLLAVLQAREVRVEIDAARLTLRTGESGAGFSASDG